MNIYSFSFIGKKGGSGGSEDAKLLVEIHNLNPDSHPDKISVNEKGSANGVASLDGAGMVPVNQLNLNSLKYKGAWDALTNTPSISNLTGSKDDFWIVSVEGTQNLGDSVDGSFIGVPELYEIGSNLVHNGIQWEQIRSKQKVTSVNGKIGEVVIDKFVERNIKLGDTTKKWDGSTDLTFTKAEIGAGGGGGLGFFILENGVSDTTVPKGNLIFRKN